MDCSALAYHRLLQKGNGMLNKYTSHDRFMPESEDDSSSMRYQSTKNYSEDKG